MIVARRRGLRRLVALLTTGLSIVVAAPPLPPPASAGLVPMSRLSELHVQGQHAQTPINENLSFDEFGPYDNLISTVAGNDGSNQVRGKVEQTADVDISLPQRINVSAMLRAEASVALVANDLTSPTFIASGTDVTVDFRVTDQAAFVATSGEFDHLSASGATDSSSIVISELGAPAGETPFSMVLDNEMSLTFARNFTLEPGTYRMAAHTKAAASGSSSGDPFSDSQSSQMNFAFAVSAEGLAAIPLPAAVAPGAVMLLGAQAAIMMRRRYAR